MMDLALEQLDQLLRFHSWTLNPTQLGQLHRFMELLLERNQSLNLTRIQQPSEVVLKHFVDSFMVDRLLALPSPLLDLGTGGGFPGIPLKILRPDLHLILAEGLKKRVVFLREIKEELGLSEGLDIVGEGIDRRFKTPVRGVITRAVEDAEVTLKRVRGCLLKDGLVLLMKGPNCDEERARAEKHCVADFVLEKDLSYQLPESVHGRRLLVFRRVSGLVDSPLDAPQGTDHEG
jgi:16S rRNA (guanine(527)-N(7))-methyltransferase RsmG